MKNTTNNINNIALTKNEQIMWNEIKANGYEGCSNPFNGTNPTRAYKNAMRGLEEKGYLSGFSNNVTFVTGPKETADAIVDVMANFEIRQLTKAGELSNLTIAPEDRTESLHAALARIEAKAAAATAALRFVIYNTDTKEIIGECVKGTQDDTFNA